MSEKPFGVSELNPRKRDLFECPSCPCRFFTLTDLSTHSLIHKRARARASKTCEGCGAVSPNWVVHHVTYGVSWYVTKKELLSGLTYVTEHRRSSPILMILCRRCHLEYHRGSDGRPKSLFWGED